MNICQHHHKLTQFCIHPNCNQKIPAGCQICIKKYHNHNNSQKQPSKINNNNNIIKYHIKQAQIIQLLRIHSNHSSQTKPKCRNLQDAIHNHFLKLKNQVNAFFQTIDKNFIHRIGYPSLFQNQKLFATYKRLKNKQYKKLEGSQFRQLIKQLEVFQKFDKNNKINKISSNINEKEKQRQYYKILENDTRIYYQNVQKIHSVMKEVCSLVQNMEKISKNLQLKWECQKSNPNEVYDLIKVILNSKDTNKLDLGNQKRDGSVPKKQTNVWVQNSKEFPKSGRFKSNQFQRNYQSVSVNAQKYQQDKNQVDKTSLLQKQKKLRQRYTSSIEKTVSENKNLNKKEIQQKNQKQLKAQITIQLNQQQKHAKISILTKDSLKNQKPKETEKKSLAQSTDPYEFYKNKYKVGNVGNVILLKNESMMPSEISSKQQEIKQHKQKLLNMFMQKEISPSKKSKISSSNTKQENIQDKSDRLYSVPKQILEKGPMTTTITGKASQYQKDIENQELKLSINLQENRLNLGVHGSPTKNKYKKYQSDQISEINSPTKSKNRDSQKSRSDQKDQKGFESVNIKIKKNQSKQQSQKSQSNSSKKKQIIRNDSIAKCFINKQNQSQPFTIKLQNTVIDEQRNSELDHTILPGEDSSEKIQQKYVYKPGQVQRIIFPIKNPLNLKKQIDKYESPLMKQRVINALSFSPSRFSKRNTHLATKSFSLNTKSSSSPKNDRKLSSIQDKQLEIKQYTQNEQKSIQMLLKIFEMGTQKAIDNLQYCLRACNTNASAAQYLSYLYLQTDQPKQCLNLCNQYLQKIHGRSDGILYVTTTQMHPDSQILQTSLVFNINKSAALNKLGRYSQSIKILQKCQTFKQKDLIFKNQADAYFSIGIIQKAIYYYQKTLQICEQFDQAHYNLAVCLYTQQNYRNAKLSIDRALDYAPLNEDYKQLAKHINQRIR